MYFHVLEGDLELYLLCLSPTLHPHCTPKFWLGESGEGDWGAWGWSKTLKGQEGFKQKQREEKRAIHVKAKGQEIQWGTRFTVKRDQHIDGPNYLHKEFVSYSVGNGEITDKFCKWDGLIHPCHSLLSTGMIMTKDFEHVAPLPRMFLILLLSLENSW